MNSSDMVRRVQKLFGDESEAQIDIPFILDMLNDGQMDVARRTGVLDKHVQTSAIKSDGSYTVPEDFLSIHRVTYNNRVVTSTTINQVDTLDPKYDAGSNTGTPTHYFLSGRVLFLFPVPNSTGTDNLDLWYTKTPSLFAALGDPCELPVNYHEDVVRYALARCKESDNDFEISNQIMGNYELRMTDSTSEAHDRHEDSYPSVRLLPGDY